MAASNQPNTPIDMGPYLGQGGRVMNNDNPLFPQSHDFEEVGAPFKVQAAPKPVAKPAKAEGGDDPAGFQQQTVNTPPPAGGVPAYATGEQEQGVKPSKWDQWVARLKEQSMSGPLGFYQAFDYGSKYEGSLTRGFEENLAAGVQQDAGINKLSPEEANAQYPGLPEPFKEPIYPEVARLRWEAHQRRQHLEDWISRGPNTGFFFNLGAGAVGSLDPLYLATNLATAGLGRAAGLATTGLKGVRNAFISNLAINTGGELLNRAQQTKEGEKLPSLASEMPEILGGTVAGMGIHMAFGKLIHMSAETVAKNLKVAVAQHELGGRVDMGPQGGEAAQRSSGAVQPGTATDPYVYTPIQHPSEKAFYAAEAAGNGEHLPLNDLGPGAYGTDHGQIANNLASEPESSLTGKVHEFRVDPKAKFLNLDEPVSSPEGKSFIDEAAKRTGVDMSRMISGLDDTSSIHDALKHISRIAPEDMGEVQQIAKGMGYDGYQYTDQAGGSTDNRVLMFEGSEGRHVGSYDANKETTPQLNPGEVQDQLDRTTSKEASPLAAPEVDRTLSQKSGLKPPDPKILDPVIAQRTQEAQKLLQSYASEDPSLQKEMEGLNRKKATEAQEKGVAEALADCMGKNLT